MLALQSGRLGKNTLSQRFQKRSTAQSRKTREHRPHRDDFVARKNAALVHTSADSHCYMCTGITTTGKLCSTPVGFLADPEKCEADAVYYVSLYNCISGYMPWNFCLVPETA